MLVASVPLFLVSCGGNEASTATGATATGKTDFFVEIIEAKDLPRTSFVEKTARLTSTSQLTLTALGSARVASIRVVEGSSVSEGAVLATLEDTTMNYALSSQGAQTALERSMVEQEASRIQSEKNIADARLALQRAEKDLSSAISSREVQLEKTRYDVENTSLGSSTSSARLSLDRLEADISRSQTDIDTLIRRQDQTLKNFAPTYQLTVGDLERVLSTLLYDSDRLVGISDQNRTLNDAFETYLGGRDSSIRPEIERQYALLSTRLTDLQLRKNATLDASLLLSELDRLDSAYRETSLYAALMVELLENSIESGSNFSRQVIDTSLKQYQGYESQIQGLRSAYINFRSSAASFLATYESERKGQQGALASLRAQYEVQKQSLQTASFDASIADDRAQISSSDTLKSAQIARENARLALQNALDSAQISRERAALSVQDARLASSRAQTDTDRLVIRAPVAGKVSRVLLSPGQELAPGAPAFELIGAGQEVVVSLEWDLARSLSVGSMVGVRDVSSSRMGTGTIVGIGASTDSALLTSVRVGFPADSALLAGSLVSLRFPRQSSAPLLPLSALELIAPGEARIRVLSGSTILTMRTPLGETFSWSVSLLDPLDPSLRIILSDTREYDSERMEVRVKNNF